MDAMGWLKERSPSRALVLVLPWAAIVAMAFPVPASTAGVDAGAAPTAPAKRPAADWPAGAPVAAAVIVHWGAHDRAHDRLALADLVQGTYEDIAEADTDTDPVWSPDGTELAYVTGSALKVRTPGQSAAIRVRGGLGSGKRSLHGMAFSPDGQRLALALPKGIELYRMADTPVREAAVSRGLIHTDVRWAPDGRRLAACRWNGKDGEESRESLAVYALQAGGLRQVQQIRIPNCAMLGFRDGHWLAARGGNGDPAVVSVSPEGKIVLLRELPTEHYVEIYLRGPDAVVTFGAVDDQCDPTRATLFSLTGNARRPWLRKHRDLIGLAANEAGSFVLFTEYECGTPVEQSGRIFLAATDGQTARQVLPVRGRTPKNVFFSHPIPRPLPRTPQ